MNEKYLRVTTRIKADAEPIDNVAKFAWADEDYETVEEWAELTDEEAAAFETERATAEIPTRVSEAEDALADLGEVVSGNEINLNEIMDAIAELGELVSELKGANND